MTVSIVNVLNKEYSKLMANVSVQLYWDNITDAEKTNLIFTNSNGQALICHRNTGNAVVLIGGVKHSIMSTPGIHTVVL